ncbi:hypothetical protein EVAR_32868_1 [Eumeta japonica]|uniref:Uncharacterized protein n=1 Tax=Eumeta variegata TaxID=151549 RepID=A0A4C1VRP6_EUMVA|nr:hypothetical protein EVAR_32868_1 [Eumeta japonica]
MRRSRARPPNRSSHLTPHSFGPRREKFTLPPAHKQAHLRRAPPRAVCKPTYKFLGNFCPPPRSATLFRMNRYLRVLVIAIERYNIGNFVKFIPRGSHAAFVFQVLQAGRVSIICKLLVTLFLPAIRV